MAQTSPPTPADSDYFVGFKPESRTRHGWALIEVKNDQVVHIHSGYADGAGLAVAQVNLSLDGATPRAIGVDAALYWVSEGDRNIDVSLRRRVLSAGGQADVVPSANSQQGVRLVQGVIVAQTALQTWPWAMMTEVNPKALLLLSPQANQFLYQHFSDPSKVNDRDAVLAAYSAWQGSIRQLDWRDLASLDREAFMPVSTEVSYWFPLV